MYSGIEFGRKRAGVRMAKVKRIALLIGQDIGYCRGVLRGIHAYSVHDTNWVFHDARPEMQSLGPLQEWQPHGIIAHLFDAAFARCVLALKKPLVNVTATFLDLPAPLVDLDNRLAGRMAAAHFLDRGFRNFGFFGSAVDRIFQAARGGISQGPGRGRSCPDLLLLRVPAPPAGRFELEIAGPAGP